MISTATSIIRTKFAKLVLYPIEANIIQDLTTIFPASPSEIEKLLRVCMSLIHTPVNYLGLLNAKAAMRTLVRKILETSDTVNRYAVIIVDDMLCSFFELLAKSTNQKTLTRRVHVTAHPEFAFFVTAAMLTKTPTPLYAVFCIRFQIALEKICGWHIERNTKEAYLRACRYFFEYMPSDIKFDVTLPTRQFVKSDFLSLIESSFEEYATKNKAKTVAGVFAPAKRYKDMLKTLLFKNKDVSSHPHSGARNKKTKKDSLTVTKIRWSETPDKPGGIAPGYEDSGPAETEVGEAVMPRKKAAPDLSDIKDDSNESFSIYYVMGDEISIDMQTAELQRRLRLRIFDALNLRSFIFNFDVRYPNLWHISILVIKITELWAISSIIDQFVIVLLEILIWTGNHPNDVMLLGMHTGEKMPVNFDKHKLFITKSVGRYYLLKEALIQYKKTPQGSQNCRTTTKIIKIPLPHTLTPYIDITWGDRIGGGYFFSAISPSTEPSFGLDIVREFLDRHINSKFNLSLTPHRVASAFFPIFNARYGLDEILAYYISNQHQTLFRARSHYLHFNPVHLEIEYLRVAEIVNKKIENNAKSVLKIRQQYFPADVLNKYVPLLTTDSVTDGLPNPTGIEYGYGSAIVPAMEPLRNYVVALKDKIMSKRWNSIIERHNLYIAYTYLCAMFNFALRPRNEPHFSFYHFAKRSSEVINDKQSCRFYEDRLLPVTRCLAALAENYRHQFPQLLKHLGGRLDPSVLNFSPDNFFFFLSDRKGKPKKFLLPTWRQILQKAGVPYPFNMRSPRHFVKTTFYENDICDELNDAWHGHTHIAREPLGITSSVVFAEMVAHGLPIIETMLNEMGFLPIPYLPQDKD